MTEKAEGPVARFLIKLGIVERLIDEPKIDIKSKTEKEAAADTLKSMVEKQSFIVELEDGTSERVVALKDLEQIIGILYK